MLSVLIPGRSATFQFLLFALMACSFAVPSNTRAECPEEPPLLNYTGSGGVVCPCFISGEEAGVVLDAPSDHYPIEILRVGIGWASQFGGSPQSLEQSIHIYGAGLPNPGTPIFSLDGPVLNDGFLNEFDLEPLPGEVLVDSGPFTVTLEFLNSNSGDPFAASVFHDGNGCQAGKNVVKAIPGGWSDACVLGVTGDWVMYVVYRQTGCEAGIGDQVVASGDLVALAVPQPNPFTRETLLEFVLTGEQAIDLAAFDVRGKRVSTIARGTYGPGSHAETWSGRGEDGAVLAPGVYFIMLEAGGHRSTQRVVLGK